LPLAIWASPSPSLCLFSFSQERRSAGPGSGSAPNPVGAVWLKYIAASAHRSTQKCPTPKPIPQLPPKDKEKFTDSLAFRWNALHYDGRVDPDGSIDSASRGNTFTGGSIPHMYRGRLGPCASTLASALPSNPTALPLPLEARARLASLLLSTLPTQLAWTFSGPPSPSAKSQSRVAIGLPRRQWRPLFDGIR